MKFPSPQQASIKLNGFLGQFQSPNSSIRIVFFSTVANTQDGAYASFLRRLIPMREKYDTSSIRDFDTLLQRDIDDSRIAQELIPYLLNSQNGGSSHVSFFPSVLCVLMPKNFLDNSNRGENNLNGEALYPSPSLDRESNPVIEYGRSWTLTQFFDDRNEKTGFAQLEIFENTSDFLVLDGQHRTNAFRAVAGFFPEPNSVVYSSFYEGLSIPSEISSDLPVTLIWFESECGEISPSYISRDLFIDVNNNAKPISSSRLILLNDKEPSNIITKYFYSYLAQNFGFSLTRLSVFHFAFDYSGNLYDKALKICPLNIFAPEILNHSFDWFFFSKPGNYTVGKSSVYRGQNTDYTYFSRYFSLNSSDYFGNALDQFGDLRKIVLPSANISQLKERCISSDSFGHIYDLYSRFPLIKKFVNATSQIFVQYENRTGIFNTVPFVDTFRKAILGGESLYYSLMKSTGNASTYRMALEEQPNGIIATFIQILASQFSTSNVNVKDLYARISTNIFSTGYLMAFSHFQKEKPNLSIADAKEEFLSRIEAITENQWVHFFTDFWGGYFDSKDATPRLWPMVTNMVLRLIQQSGEFFDVDAPQAPQDRIRKLSPEVVILKSHLYELLDQYRSTQLGGKSFDACLRSEFAPVIDSCYTNAINYMTSIFSGLGIQPDQVLSYDEICEDYFVNLVIAP